MSSFTFNANAHKPSPHKTVIPAGSYIMRVVSAEIKPDFRDADILHLVLEFVGGHYRGLQLYPRFLVNIDRCSRDLEKGMNDSLLKLATLCKAVGIDGFSDPNELCGKPFYVRLSVRLIGGSADKCNDIEEYISLDDFIE